MRAFFRQLFSNLGGRQLASLRQNLLSIHTSNTVLKNRLEVNTLLTAQLYFETKIAPLGPNSPLSQAEFRVFSQNGEDGILQYLFHHIDAPQTFVEFGVEDYQEANTRYLLIKNNWRGLVLDGTPSNISAIRQDDLFWRYDLQACEAFITRENINDLLEENGFTGDIGLLSIDIDGNDYWVWEAITVARPAVVVCEYNSFFGTEHTISIPYQPDFTRMAVHYSGLYYGASLTALCHLAEKKEYIFVGCDSKGVNAFFVSQEYAEPFKALTTSEGYVESRFRQSRDKEGKLSYVSGKARLSLVKDMLVYDFSEQKEIYIKDLFQLD